MKDTKVCIIARHGHSDATAQYDGGLTATGREQVEWLAKALPERVCGSAVILSSSSRRGKETTEILTKALGAPAIFDEMLWKDNQHLGGSFEEIAELAERHACGIETLIIVGHMDHGDMLARHVARKVYSLNLNIPFGEPPYGGACIVNRMESSYVVIP